MKPPHEDKSVDGAGLPTDIVGLLHAQWPALSATQLQQGWRRLDAKRSARPAYFKFALFAATAATALLIYTQSLRITYEVKGGAFHDRKLAVGQGQAATISFSDGTRIDARAQSETELLETTRSGAYLRVHHGAVALHVKRRAGARWRVAAGPFTVAVKGTTFDVNWEAQTLTVRLAEGRVDVTGPLLDGLVVLRPGQRLVANLITRETRIDDGNDKPSVAPEQPAAPEEPKTRPSASSLQNTRRPNAPIKQAISRVHPRPTQGWSQQMGRGGFHDVIVEARAFGIKAAVAGKPLADVAALADAARYERENDIAEVALLALRRRWSAAPVSKDAAFHLGRLAEGAANVAAAMRWYETYLTESPRGTFYCECLGRKMSLLIRQANAPNATEAARQYLARCAGGAFEKTARALQEK